jgi:hypothetical protein
MCLLAQLFAKRLHRLSPLAQRLPFEWQARDTRRAGEGSLPTGIGRSWMQSKTEQSETLTMQLTCEHAAIHIVNDVATCTDCGHTLGCIDKHDEQGAAVLVECLTCISEEDPDR